MKTIKLLTSLLVLTGVVMLASCATSSDSNTKSASKDVLYTCGCGPDCKCSTVSTTAGKCGCGHALVAGKVKKVEGDTALLCMCGPTCGCELDPKDATKCGCGKPIKKASLKGTGIYFCNCGGSCTCNTVSAQPDKCKCGMALKKAD